MRDTQHLLEVVVIIAEITEMKVVAAIVEIIGKIQMERTKWSLQILRVRQIFLDWDELVLRPKGVKNIPRSHVKGLVPR